MDTLSNSSIIQLDRISQLLTLHHQSNLNYPQSRFISSNQKRFAVRNLIIQELNSLKSKIIKVLKKSQSLQNQNRVLKRMITRQNSTCSMYSNQMDSWSENCLLNKYLTKVTSSNYSNGCQMTDSKINFTKTNFSTSFSQFEKIKQEVVGLTQNLQSITKAYEKYELDSTNDNEIKDMFLSESSLIRFSSKEINQDNSNSREEIQLQNLLCNEELSLDDLPLQDSSLQQIKIQQNMVDSLIAKGIEFRELRTLRSKQYQVLSQRIQQYRGEFVKKNSFKRSSTESISKYR